MLEETSIVTPIALNRSKLMADMKRGKVLGLVKMEMCFKDGNIPERA